MLKAKKFKISTEAAQGEAFSGAVAVSTKAYDENVANLVLGPLDISAAVSVLSERPLTEPRLKYVISVFSKPSDVIDSETDEFLPGIEATAYMDWHFQAELLPTVAIAQAIAEAQERDFYFVKEIPELALTLFGSGYSG